jgi:prephenate dehydratase
MEIGLTIVGIVVGIVSAYVAYLQLKRTPNPPDVLGPAKATMTPLLATAEAGSDMKSMVTGLLPAELHGLFTYAEHVAHTEEDVAGLSLISEVIDKVARRDIHVIGRGTQLVESKTRAYVSAVANAILREVAYKRILIIDPAFPQNALLWLLLIERFLASPRWRDSVSLYVVEMNSTNLAAQFQIVDGKFLHRVQRNYSATDFKPSERAQSIFALLPDKLVSQHCNTYQTHLLNAGHRYEHHDVTEYLAKMLHHLAPQKHDISYHWQLVLDVVDFLGSLEVPNLPPSRIKFVGCLMPFTFTYEAAGKFVREMNESTREGCVIALPFRRMEDAINEFLAKRLDYLCVPIENSRVDNLIPPTTDELLLESLRKDSQQVYEVELPVRFVLAGVYRKAPRWRKLVAVEAAYLQISERLPRNAKRLPRSEEEVESNYHAAWLARSNTSLVAVTTPAAAKYFVLHVYSDLHSASERNATKFAVYAHSNAAKELPGGAAGEMRARPLK